LSPQLHIFKAQPKKLQKPHMNTMNASQQLHNTITFFPCNVYTVQFAICEKKSWRKRLAAKSTNSWKTLLQTHTKMDNKWK